MTQPRRYTTSCSRFLFLRAPQEVEDDDPATRRGFDALRNNGMTRGEVTAIRGYFSSQVREVSPAGDSIYRRGGLAEAELMEGAGWARAGPVLLV